MNKRKINSCRRLITIVGVGQILLLSACASTPEMALVQDLEIPDYKAREHRIDYPIDLFIEPRIPALRARVVPQAESKVYSPVTIVAGPALEEALLTLTRQHFSKANQVELIHQKPTLAYKLLAFKPAISVVPGAIRSQLTVSSRVAIEMTLQSATGEILYSATAIGTSHVSDTKLSPGRRLSGYGALLEVVTQNAIIDAMYEISKNFDDNERSVNVKMQNELIAAKGYGNLDSFDDVIMYLRTTPFD